MENTLESLKQESVFQHFYQICQIPHGSGNEKALSDHLLHWARQLGLEAVQDDHNNVFIRKPATPGYENAPAVMLQAHIDMVCEKAEGVDHDFARDPIHWEVEGDTLTTGGRTTLGADDGIGVALAMEVLTDPEPEHPALEVLFTVMEEDDFSGASNFDTAQMQAEYLINLDNADEREIICGSCGGMQVDIRIPVTAEAVPEGWQAYRLAVTGLRGGHSGEDIHRGHGSANLLLARLLMALEGCGPFRLGAIRGGSFRLAISRDAEAVVWLEPALADTAKAALAELEAQFRGEMAVTGGAISVSLTPTEAEGWCVEPDRVIDAIIMTPDGIFQMNEALEGLVDTSNNLGEIYLDRETLHFVTEIRSARDSLRSYLYQRMERLAAMFGGSCQWCSGYPSWYFRPQSRLRELCKPVYEADYGREPVFRTVHAGLEVGYLSMGKPDIDAIAFGPDCWGYHSPSEGLRISSVRKSYAFLRHLLSAMR